MADGVLTLLVDQLYPSFNQRRIDRILTFFQSDADWPNGMTGGREVGHEAIRSYWTQQFQVISSQVTPLSYRMAADVICLEVRQLIKDMEGEQLSDSVVFHTYRFVDGKVQRMDISDQLPEGYAHIPGVLLTPH